jgi:hypothetical protein
MATSGLVVRRFTEVLGLPSPSSLNRTMQTLRDADLVPLGRGGRASQHGHYEVSDLANAIMGMAGAQPSDAAAAVKLLRPLTFARALPQIHPGPCLPGDFGNVLERLIKADPPPPVLPVAQGSLQFRFCLNQPWVEITYSFPNRPPQEMVTGGNTRLDLYLDPRRTYPRWHEINFRRLTDISGPVILAARDLLADTQRVLATSTADVPKDENRRFPWQGGGG